MSEPTGLPPDGPPDGDPEEPLDLEELRQARELAAALDGKGGGATPEVEAALRGAALLALGREPALSDEDVVRLLERVNAGSAANARPVAGRGRAWGVPRLAAVAAVAAAVIVVAVVESRSPAPTGPRASPAVAARGQAQLLVASLLPEGGSPTGRARVIEAAARARTRAGREGGR